MTSNGRRAIPYGSWPSALTADRILAGALRLGQPQLDAGDVYWLEGRPSEGGRQVILRAPAAPEDAKPEDVTPADVNVRTLVHEYGGGDYRVRAGQVVHTRFGDQRAWLTTGDGTHRPLVPAGPRYADFAWAPDGTQIAAVEQREVEGHEPENRIVVFRVVGAGEAPAEPLPVAVGHDFVSSPCFSPTGNRLAYLAWDHPRMPWDGTRLCVQDWDPAGPVGRPIGEPEVVAGGDTESVFQPRFSPDGQLTFVSDRSGWWNLYRLEADGVRALCPLDAEFGRPQWVFGLSTYAFVSDDEILCSVSRAGFDALHRLDLATGRLTRIDLPFSHVSGIDVEDGSACFVAGGPDVPTAIHRMELATGKVTELRRSFDVELDPAAISLPEPIEFETGGGRTAHAFFYPPTNPNAEAPADERPPLLVKSHGGPTAATLPVLSLAIQYWTSRGIAVVDVNYGGSTGYGREYRERLRGQWGLVDVEDCVNAALHLADAGRVDRARLAISGGSAGGYTTLCALTFRDVFAAGASHYGIGDLEALAQDTHKFESRYLDGLIGPYPEARDVYRERSPIHFTEQLACPVIFFQGLDDKVVPPNQAAAMVAALATRGVTHAHVTFPGEQHGFRRAENIRTALEGELYFYGRIFGFEVDVLPAGIEIVG